MIYDMDTPHFGLENQYIYFLPIIIWFNMN